MKEHTEFNETSRFIDVGSGVGKPNLHVAQDPGVALSYGVEVEPERWLLSMHGLDGMLVAMDEQGENVSDEQEIQGRCMFVLGDIRQANTFDPFTHVYMFSIGFPPKLWHSLAEMWNRSSNTAQYMICFHSPKDIIDCYEFDVELVVQTPTSMHGSKEGHTGYIYRRTIAAATSERESTVVPATIAPCCDPFFAPTWELVNSGFDQLKQNVREQLQAVMTSGVSTRARRSPSKT
jgi:Histone methylation protein DOT1